MKKIIMKVLVLSLLLTIVVCAMPTYQNSSVIMTDTQMMGSVGGCNAVGAAAWGVGAILASATPFGWFCAGMGAGLLIACMTQ